MNIAIPVIVLVVLVVFLFFITRIVKSCLPKIIFGLIVLGVIAFLVYYYWIK
jgi:hypothetical protein